MAGGPKNLTADELNVRASIMFEARRFEEAKACAGVGLQRTDLLSNTRCLLLLNSAQALEKLGEDVAAAKAFQQAYGLKDELPPGTQARLLRALANSGVQSGVRKSIEQMPSEGNDSSAPFIARRWLWASSTSGFMQTEKS